jgi:hypothetical protein
VKILRRHGEPRRLPLDRQKAIAQVLRLLQQGHSFRASARDEGTIRRRCHNPELDAACRAAQGSATATRKAAFLRLIRQGMPARTAAEATAGRHLLRRWRTEDAAFAVAYEALVEPRRPAWKSRRHPGLLVPDFPAEGAGKEPEAATR